MSFKVLLTNPLIRLQPACCADAKVNAAGRPAAAVSRPPPLSCAMMADEVSKTLRARYVVRCI
jgi:hypothetical protein